MSSRTSLILALALLATSNTSVYARPQPHPNLRAGKISVDPLADKKLVKDSALEVVEIPSWKDIEVPVSLSHRDEN
jgi:hypothetical protein